MILIADSGSTKTDWCVVEKGELVQQIFTKGTNPFFQSEEEISKHRSLTHKCVSLFPWTWPVTSGMTEPGFEGAEDPAEVVSAEFMGLECGGGWRWGLARARI